MRFLVIGAGVLGKFYAAKLAVAGYDITVLARGANAAQITASGLVIEEPGRKTLRVPVRVTTTLLLDDAYDYVLVFVRNDQVESVLPLLAAHRATPNIVFMNNNAAGPQHLTKALGQHRVILGFPGAGGERTELGAVRATIVPPVIQKTTIGEIDGVVSARVRTLAKALRGAGFPTTISRNMDAWLKTHAALVCPIAEAFYTADSNLQNLASDKLLASKMVQAVRSNFTSLRAKGIPVTPSKLRCIEMLPEYLLVYASRLALRTSGAELLVARHATVARTEMTVLAEQLRSLIG